ncbi:hypothetical protein CPB86DRAFT_772065 [Serendipita vermifera]|nr:hypothetical protein CPB86DRAFT_772065 [Serendipita vermifera]
MPPQAGTFAIPPTQQQTIMPYPNPNHPYSESSNRPKRKRSPKDIGGASLARDDLSQKAAELSMKLTGIAQQLSTDPTEDRGYQLQLYPITLERAARLNMAMLDYEAMLLRAEQAYTDETTRVEEEWVTGKSRVRERLLDGIEERRRKAREEKDADGLGSDLVIDAQARPHITRKVKEKLVAAGNSSPKPTTPLLQPNGNSLRMEDISTPFPLALTSVPLPPAAVPVAPTGGRRKGKGGAQAQSLFAKGVPSYFHLTEAKDQEKESDLGEIRRASRRKRGQARV